MITRIPSLKILYLSPLYAPVQDPARVELTPNATRDTKERYVTVAPLTTTFGLIHALNVQECQWRLSPLLQ